MNLLPGEFGTIDTMIGFPNPDQAHYVPPNVRGDRSGREHAAAYLFSDTPAKRSGADDGANSGADDASAETDPQARAIASTLAAMDANGVQVGLVSMMSPMAVPAAKTHPDRFVLATHIDPNGGMDAVRRIRDDAATHNIRAVSLFPAGTEPQTPPSAAQSYAIFATCAELSLPVFVNVGIPGPRVPAVAQQVHHLDQICYDFPELVVVMRHGGEPWAELAVKLMLKWPGLHYSTSAFAPKHYPQAILDFADRRGSDQVLYGGYYPYGLELDRIFNELRQLPLREETWPKFLRTNAARILGIS